MMTASPDSWMKLWREIGATDDGLAVYRELVSLYSEPHRHYHNFSHIAGCLEEFESARASAQQPPAVELAIWFHDAIYDTHAADNEEKSAEMAMKRISDATGNADLCKSVRALVMATKAHDAKLHPDAPLLVDVDLSIFGKSEERFWEYEAQIRREYDWVPEAVFATKRADILQRFLAREQIYSTRQFFKRYEKQARANIQASVQRLKKQ
jgi:predicted metal-dependent HD superfamily phosphohydrolase